MSLDIQFTARENVVCPKCGEVVATEAVASEGSGGRAWYSILEEIGYYVPYEQRTEENDWYGKDMALTEEQAKEVYRFVVKNNDLYNCVAIRCLIAMAIVEKLTIIVNANW